MIINDDDKQEILRCNLCYVFVSLLATLGGNFGLFLCIRLLTILDGFSTPSSGKFGFSCRGNQDLYHADTQRRNIAEYLTKPSKIELIHSALTLDIH